jgi:predicted metalloprotease with PDZ domain
VGDRVARAGGGKGPLIFLYLRLAHYRPGEHVTVLVARRERLQRLAVTFGAEPPKYGQLEVLSDATAEQRARLAAWLGCPSTTVPAL